MTNDDTKDFLVLRFSEFFVKFSRKEVDIVYMYLAYIVWINADYVIINLLMRAVWSFQA